MKKWPKDNKIVPIDELLNPLKDSFDKAINWTNRLHGQKIPYDGYNTPSTEATSSPVDEQLSPELIEYHLDHGRDIIDVFLMIAFQLGFEQGKRFIESDEARKLLERAKKYFEETDE